MCGGFGLGVGLGFGEPMRTLLDGNGFGAAMMREVGFDLATYISM